MRGMAERQVIYRSTTHRAPDLSHQEATVAREEKVPQVFKHERIESGVRFEPEAPVKVNPENLQNEDPYIEKLMDSVGLGADLPSKNQVFTRTETIYSGRRSTRMLPKIILGFSATVVVVLLGYAIITREQGTSILTAINPGQYLPETLDNVPSEEPEEGGSLLGSLFGSQELPREKTDVALEQTYYVLVRGRTSDSGLGRSGEIISGQAMPPDKVNVSEVTNAQSTAQAQRSTAVLESWSKDDKVLASAPVQTDGDATFRETGTFNTYLLLPRGTNSVVLKIRDGEALDRIYAPQFGPVLSAGNIPALIKIQESLPIDLEVSDRDMPTFVDIHLYDGVTRTLIPLEENIQAKNGVITKALPLPKDKILRTTRYKVRYTLQWFFGSEFYYSQEILVQV